MPSDLFYYLAVTGILIIAISFALVSYHLIQTLKSMKKVLDDIGSTSKDLRAVKDGFKKGILGILGIIIQTLKRR